MKRLVIIADEPLVAHAIRQSLRQAAGFQVVGCLDGRSIVSARVVELRPDVVVIDDMRDPAHASARLREVADVAPKAKLVLLAARMDDQSLHEVFDAGAGAVLSKDLHTIALGTLLRETVRGNVVHRYQPPQPQEDEECPLTGREIEILRFAAQGYTNGRIARELWITEQTVKFHLSNTYRKLGVTNRTEASRYAYANALVSVAAPRELLMAS